MDSSALKGSLNELLGDFRSETVYVFDETDSTNNVCKRMAAGGAPEGTAVLSLKQTAGRGRLGRSFLSPEGEGIYLSFLFRPSCSPEKAAELTSWVAVAACRALAKACGISPQIKWVNDLLLNRMKVGGILCEMSVGGSGTGIFVVAGVGINVLQKSFSAGLEKKASSLLIETGKIFPFDRIVSELIGEFDALAAAFPGGKEDYLAEYRALCSTVGSTVVYERPRTDEDPPGEETVKCTAFAEGIDDDFALLVRNENGQQIRIRTGEVSVRGLYGYV